jgi:hypothetical protein
MVHKEKNIETKLPRLRIIIKLGGCLAGLAAVVGVLHAFYGSISTIVGVYLGYRILRLLMRLFGLLCATVFTLFSILILFLIISLIIF